MSKLNEQSRWESEIYQIEKDDDVRGGESGAVNVQSRQIANRTQYLKNLFDMLSNVAFTATEPYASKDAAQAAINSGAEKRRYFNVIRIGDYNVERYENINGVATATGNTLASGAFVEKLAKVVNFIETSAPPELAYSSTDWHHGWTDADKNLLMGLDLTGGLNLCDMPDSVQDRLAVIGDYFTRIRTPGFHKIIQDAQEKTGFAIADDWSVYVAGLELSVQDEISNLKNGAGSAILRPYNGVLAVFKDTQSPSPVYAVNPVAHAQKLITGGASIVYDENGSMKMGTLNLRDPVNNFEQRPLPSYIRNVLFRFGTGQSLMVGGGESVTAIDQRLLGHALMFMGAGADRGASWPPDGPVTDEALAAFTDGLPARWRANCMIPGAQRFLNNLLDGGGVEKTALPATVSRMDAKSGTAYSGLKKGTQVFSDGMTSFASFVKRTLEQGKTPVAHSIFNTHGEKDSEIVRVLGEYKRSADEWFTDIQNGQLDILAAHGIIQTKKPHVYIDQMGSIGRTEKNRGDIIAYDQLAISLERNDVSMSVNKTHLNIRYAIDDVHLSGVGYGVLGDYQGQAEAFNYIESQKVDGKKWDIPHVTNVDVVGNKVKVTLHSPLGLPMKINYDYGMRHDLGALFNDGSAKILNAEQESDFVIVFNCDKPPAVGDYLCLGYTSEEFKYPLICISDTSKEVSTSDPSFVMENFCARQQFLIK
jgi:hypothetical protein